MVRSCRSGSGVNCRLRLPARNWLSAGIPLVMVTATCVSQLGCGSKESVRHYKVPKPDVLFATNHVDAQEQPLASTASDQPADRMLGAIVPRESQTWCFKLTGPLNLVAQQEPAFRQFVESLQFAGPDAPPQWTLPASWQEEERSNQEAARLSVEVDGRKLEVSIILLPASTSPSNILDNVNRWRRQMRVKPLDIAQLEKETTTLKLADGTAVFVNLVGNYESGELANGAMANARPQRTTETPQTGLRYEKPDSWLDEPPVSFSVLAFGVRDGSATAQITVSPLKGDAGGVLANLNRWFTQAGLPPLEEKDFATKTEEMVVQGIRGTYAEAVGEDTQAAGDAIVGWIGFQAGQTWFVKMKGDRQLVLGQRETFRNFLQTLQFSANDGAGNGN